MQVKDFLTHPRFVLVDNREDADILWLMEHFKDFRLVAVRNVHVPLAVFLNFLLTTCPSLVVVVVSYVL